MIGEQLRLAENNSDEPTGKSSHPFTARALAWLLDWTKNIQAQIFLSLDFSTGSSWAKSPHT